MTPDEARALIAASGIREGDPVEWRMGSGTIDRGVVSSVTEARVYVRNQRTRTHGRGAGQSYDCEFWWGANELERLRKIEP